MKPSTKIMVLLALLSFISLSLVHGKGFDRRSAAAGVVAGMYIQKNKAEILSWSRLLSYEILKKHSKKYGCENLPEPSQNGASEYIRGLCTFVNEKDKQDVYEGLNALSFAVLNTYEDKKEEAVCTASLAFFVSRNYGAAQKLAALAKRKHYKSELCKHAQNIVAWGVFYKMKYPNRKPGNVCVH